MSNLPVFIGLAAVFLLLPAQSTEGADGSKIRNVLFLISDDLKASTLGCYGDRLVQTPNIDRLAKEGVVFDRAYCQGTSCAPSRQSFMFSRYKGAGQVNMGQHFRENGLYSARVGKIYHMRVPGDIIAGTDGSDVLSSWTERFNSSGLEAHTPGDYACLNLDVFSSKLEGRESTKMQNRMFVTVQYEGDGSDQPDWKTATKTIELLRQHKDKPFFLAAGFVRPHYPMVAPNQYFAPYRWQSIGLPEVPANDLDDIPSAGLAKTRNAKNPIGQYPDNQKRMWVGYYAAISFMDEQVGRVIAELEQLGLRDSTAIVFTSDHGYHLGEHTFWQKSNLHEEVLRVPLIISVPGMKPGRTDSLVELVDLYPTLADVLGLAIPKEVQGESLVPVLNDHRAELRNAALTVGRSGYALRSDRWAYARYHGGDEHLYDMDADPKQFTNLARSSDHQEVIHDFRKQLDFKLEKFDLQERVQKKTK